MLKSFRTIAGREYQYPLFFPDATQGMVRNLDNQDLDATGTHGVLVNTYHMWRHISEARMKQMGGIRKFMRWQGAIISDSGGFQAMSLAKRAKGMGKIVDDGIWFRPPNAPRMLLTPELSIKYQLLMETDLVVVLDEYTHEGATKWEERESVERTIAWAKRSRAAYDKYGDELEIPRDKRPYLIAVNQGGKNKELRRECNARLAEIGFDGYGHGGDGFDEQRKLDLELSQLIVDIAPQDSLMYGLGVGKPEDIVNLSRQGWQIFDCVLPTRDARHGRLYVFTATDRSKINLADKTFYEYYVPTREKYRDVLDEPISAMCDCHTCQNYSRAYLAHLFRVKDGLGWRLATIHNLRFYAMLTEILRTQVNLASKRPKQK